MGKENERAHRRTKRKGDEYRGEDRVGGLLRLDGNARVFVSRQPQSGVARTTKKMAENAVQAA
jgi:hypothetical protein